MAPRRGLLLGLAAAALGLALWLGRGARTSAERFALSPQACNTECQRQQTDCVLACEGRLPCERRCIEQGQACVKRCRQPPDAGAGGSGGGAGKGRGGSGQGGRGQRR